MKTCPLCGSGDTVHAMPSDRVYCRICKVEFLNTSFALEEGWTVLDDSTGRRIRDEEGDSVLKLPPATPKETVRIIATFIQNDRRRFFRNGEEAGAESIRNSLRQLLGAPSKEDVEAIQSKLRRSL